MACINRDAVLAAMALDEERVEIEGFDGEWIVKELPGVQQSVVLQGLQPNGEFRTDLYMQKLVAACVVDEGGNRIFDEQDVARFKRPLLSKLTRVAERVNKMNDEETEKNSEAIDNGFSTSG